jgi:hypothetical protein
MLFSCLAHPSTLKLKAIHYYETSVDFQELHSVISQKTELSITTAVETSKPTCIATFKRMRDRCMQSTSSLHIPIPIYNCIFQEVSFRQISPIKILCVYFASSNVQLPVILMKNYISVCIIGELLSCIGIRMECIFSAKSLKPRAITESWCSCLIHKKLHSFSGPFIYVCIRGGP